MIRSRKYTFRLSESLYAALVRRAGGTRGVPQLLRQAAAKLLGRPDLEDINPPGRPWPMKPAQS